MIRGSRALSCDRGCPWGAHGREVQRARRARGAGHAAPHVRGAAFVGTIFIRHQHRQNHQKFNFRQLLLGYIRTKLTNLEKKRTAKRFQELSFSIFRGEDNCNLKDFFFARTPKNRRASPIGRTKKIEEEQEEENPTLKSPLFFCSRRRREK